MKVIILAAGQGTRLRPLTDDRPKCMVPVCGKSIIERQIDVMKDCGVREEDISIVTGYRGERLREHFQGRGLCFIENKRYETTNMVCSLMCAEDVMKPAGDVIVSYGDILYDREVFERILGAEQEICVVVDDGWYDYWKKRCENPLDDAESLIFDGEDRLLEIGQKTGDIERVMSQYIGLMRFRGQGLGQMLKTAGLARERSGRGDGLWRTDRSYEKMYMTDLLQGMIDEGCELKAVHIWRGWHEVDCPEDLKVAEEELRQRTETDT